MVIKKKKTYCKVKKFQNCF